MKKQFFLLAVTVGSTFFLNAQNAQQVSFKTTTPTETSVSKPAPLPKAIKSFYAGNPLIKDAKWASTKTGYVVRYADAVMDYTVFLDSKGNNDGSIKFYSEKELNSDVRRLVKSRYYDYTIKSVKEVTFNNTTAYLITIEDAKSWKVVHVVNQETEIVEDHLNG